MNPQTKQNLLAAMHGEAFAHAKYLLYAEAARRSGSPELAVLFERAAEVELHEHFREEAELTELVGTEAVNLHDAIEGEAYEVETMYADFARQAEDAGEKAAAERFREIRSDEAQHLVAFQSALGRIDVAVTAARS